MSEYNFISWHFIGVLVLRYSAEQSTIFILETLKLNLELLLSCVTLNSEFLWIWKTKLSYEKSD